VVVIVVVVIVVVIVVVVVVVVVIVSDFISLQESCTPVFRTLLDTFSLSKALC